MDGRRGEQRLRETDTRTDKWTYEDRRKKNLRQTQKETDTKTEKWTKRTNERNDLFN